MARRIKVVRRDAIQRARRKVKLKHKQIMVGYQYHPPKKTWRQKLREILKILRE